MGNVKRILSVVLVYTLSVIAGNGTKTNYTRYLSKVYPVQREMPAYSGMILVKRPESLYRGGDQIWQQALRKVNATGISREFPNQQPASPLASILRIEIPQNQNVYDAAEAFLDDPRVIWAEPLYIRRIGFDVNDPLTGSQWFLDSLHCTQAWDLARGNASIVIGIVDTGVELAHPDLQANIWTNPGEIPGDGIDNDHNGYIDDVHGWDFGNNDANPNPSSNTAATERWHGTTVAGAASAVTDNGIGIAAPAFNAGIMAVKVAEDNDPEQNIIDSHRGVVYAADQGADIINCSFGGAGASNVDREAFDYAANEGAVIVASAGNSGTSGSEYPAAYPHVLSVASIEFSGYRSSFTNYGTDVDISAYGENIFTCTINDGYRYASGTSYSSPLTAGILALIRAEHPEWTAEQVREQVRVSALPIDQLNPGFEGLLGFGRADANSALTVVSPAIRLAHLNVAEGANSNHDGVLEPGETADIVFTLKNYLAPSDPVSVSMSSAQTAVTLENPNFSFSGLGTLDSLSNPDQPLRILIDSQAKRGTEAEIQLAIQSGSYSDRAWFTIEIAPDYKTLEGSQVSLTVTSKGSLGFADYPDNTEGVGFIFGNQNLLFEGAFMAAVSPDSVSDAARGANEGVADQDFEPTPDGFVRLLEPPAFGDIEGLTKFTDAQAVNGMGLEIVTHAFVFNQTPDNDYVLLACQLTASRSLNHFYTGLFMDWDVGDNGLNASKNQPGYDPELKLAYIYDTSTNLYGGLQIFPGKNSINYRSIYNPNDIYNGFSDQEKWNYLTHGIQSDSTTVPEDYSHILGAGPMKISSHDTAYLGFAVLGGDGLDDLKANARAAMVQWQNYVTSNSLPYPTEPADTSFVLYHARPNPFSGNTTLFFEIPQSGHVRISVYDVLGRLVAVLYDDEHNSTSSFADAASVSWDGTTISGSKAASGLYFACLEYQSYRKVRKIILLQASP